MTPTHAGIVFDPNILNIEESQLMVKYLENEGAVIVGVYTVQQIHCVKNKKGEIIDVGFHSIHFPAVFSMFVMFY